MSSLSQTSANNQKLPQKEAGIFKKIVRCYECKQYKNGLKFCRQILTNPRLSEHGETLAMKGLILNCMGKKEEAYEHVRKGLKNDIKSHVCWHVYGLLQRAEKKYEEAIKCYRNALKWDKENVQILRDLSLLQIQMRDLEGFRDTRYQLLKSRPAQRSSWVGYALSYHLLKDYPMALKVMAEYRKTVTQPKSHPDVEYSEMVLYEVQLMREAGMNENAFKHLELFEPHISDLLTLQETRGELYLESGKLSYAEEIYRHLVHRNPGHYSYYDKLECCLNFGSTEEKLQHYRELQEQYPRSHVARRIPLSFTAGDTFVSLLDPYLRRSLHKGVPSLFVSIRSLYNSPDKEAILGEMLDGYLQSLRSCSRFSVSDEGPVEPPSTYLWTLFLVAQHFDQLGDHVKAIALVNEALDHTPTEVQLYMLKAKICKHAGDCQEASKWIEEARTLDTADRYVNCKSVKYLMRINKVDQGVETAGLFTREGLPPLQTMDEMQCMWFQTEMAMAYRRLNKFGDALQKLHEIEKHFVDIVDDQFDFHTYCMRKMTLRAYAGVLQLEDNLRRHSYYFEAAKCAIEIYVYLHDNPSARLTVNGPSEDMSKLSVSEQKKLQRKQRKAQLKAQAKAHEEKKENKAHSKVEEDKKAEEKESRFNPKELVSVEKPLEEAFKFLAPLQMLSRDRVEPHMLAYTIHSRRLKVLLMLQSLKRARAVDPGDGGLHEAVVDFVLLVEAHRDQFPDPVNQVITETLPQLTGGKELIDLNRHFLASHQESLEHQLCGARVLYRLQPEARDQALDIVTNLSETLKDRTHKICVKAQQMLKGGEFGDCSETLVVYNCRCHELFPMAVAFRPHLEESASTPTKDTGGDEQSIIASVNPSGGKDECSGGQD